VVLTKLYLTFNIHLCSRHDLGYMGMLNTDVLLETFKQATVNNIS